MNLALLRIADDDDVGQSIVVQLTVVFRRTERDRLDKFRPLLGEQDLVQIDLRVCHDEKVEVIAKDETKPKDALGLRKVQLDLFGLFFL